MATGTRSTLRTAPFTWVTASIFTCSCGIFFDELSDDDADHGMDDGVDAGSETDGVEGSATDADHPPRLEEGGFEGPCVPDAWAGLFETEGAPIEFALVGSEIVLTSGQAPVVESLRAPLELAFGNAGGDPIVVFDQAVVDDGVSGTGVAGTVVITGPMLLASAGTVTGIGIGTLSALHPSGVIVSPQDAPDDGQRPDLGPDAEPLHVAALAAASPFDLTLEDLQVTGYEAAYVVADGAVVPLAGPFVVDAPRVYWPIGSSILAEEVSAQYEGVVLLALEPLEGELFDGGQPVAELPLVTWLDRPALRVGPNRVATEGPFLSRYAMGRSRSLLGSSVELRICHAETLVFSPLQTRVLTLAYRQPDGLRDAAFQSISVASTDGRMWTSRIELDPLLPTTLQEQADTHPDATWARGLVNFIEGWTEATTAISRGLACAFTFGFVCPDGDDDPPPAPTPLARYPGWMEPGDLGTFELELTAPPEPGTYEVTIHITGQNYDTSISTPVVVR